MTPKFIVVSLGLIALSAVQSGQAPANAPGGASYDAIVAELHGLRGDLAQMTGTTIRTQLLVGRLQLQEQRIANVAKQLDDVRLRLSTMPMAMLPMQTELKQLEAESRSAAAPQEQRLAAERGIEAAKGRLAEMQRQTAALTDQEAMLASTLANEQGRWADFNTRLDEIERDLARR